MVTGGGGVEVSGRESFSSRRPRKAGPRQLGGVQRAEGTRECLQSLGHECIKIFTTQITTMV